jgi:cell division septation protein DedD
MKISKRKKSNDEGTPPHSSVRGIFLLLLAVAFLYGYSSPPSTSFAAGSPPSEMVFSELVKKPMPPRMTKPAEKKEVATRAPVIAQAVARIPSGERISTGKSGQTPASGAAKKSSGPTTSAGPVAKLPAGSAALQENSASGNSGKAGSGKEKFTLVVGAYVLRSSMREDIAKIRGAGFEPFVVKGPKKTETMNRLLIGEYYRSSDAASVLARLKKVTDAGFVLKENGKFVLVAGSYRGKAGAVDEQNRLRSLGFRSVIRPAQAPVLTLKLTAGRFPTADAAENGARRLEKLGVKARPAPIGRSTHAE